MGNMKVRSQDTCLSRDAPQRASVHPSVSLACLSILSGSSAGASAAFQMSACRAGRQGAQSLKEHSRYRRQFGEPVQ